MEEKVKKAGDYSKHKDKDPKQLFSISELEDVLQIPHDVMEILEDYGRLLGEIEEQRMILAPVRRLPHPKQKIEDALTTALSLAKDEDFKRALKTAQLALARFIPEDQIPEDQEEQARVWFNRMRMRR